MKYDDDGDGGHIEYYVVIPLLKTGVRMAYKMMAYGHLSFTFRFVCVHTYSVYIIRTQASSSLNSLAGILGSLRVSYCFNVIAVI